MPELPEVQTTVNGLNRTVKGRVIKDVSTTYKSAYKSYRESIKNPEYFKKFRKEVIGKKILGAERRAKNVLINLSGGKTILTHMKMTGHYVYDRPDYPHIRLDFILDNGKHLSLSDLRKFAKVQLLDTDKVKEFFEEEETGPEPTDKNFTYKRFKEQLMKRAKSKIKQVLMDQTVIAGIGNIYSDEILWRAGVHPLSVVKDIPEKNLKQMYTAMQKVLESGIHFGGDSMSDYRNIKGEKGEYQEHHMVYRKSGWQCAKKDGGVIKRISVGGRGAHFCPVHQKLLNKI